MQLSIIIVNYNVKYFLEQCLHSLKHAVNGLDAEIIVVDNNSTDGSVPYLREIFPALQIIENKCNTGFAKACNAGVEAAKGNYVLFLNPDTLLAEDSLHKCLFFLEQHGQAGALGIRMIDGRGHFLKESKRSFPSPLTSLFKLFGASVLFPRSKIFAKYHLGHLDERSNHEVDVLAGAFMMVPKKVLADVGSFDETFFMYGEDVDLSYRIQQSGYKNYYTSDSTIIHFKGESTKRGSLNYVRLFYSAMSQFVKKHYGGARGRAFQWAIQTAIWIRAFVAAFAKGVRWIGLPVIDAVLILTSFFFVKEVWTAYIRPDIRYPPNLLLIAFPAFTITFLITAYYAGLYNSDYKRRTLARSTLVATLFLLAIYALLPEWLRFSRGILLFGALTALGLIFTVRWVLVKAGIIKTTTLFDKPYILIVGCPQEADNLKALLEEAGLDKKIIGRIATDPYDKEALAQLKEVKKTAAILEAKEIIFCIGSLSYKEVIELTQVLGNDLRIRFHAANSRSIVGSDSSGSTGDVIGAETHFNLKDAGYRRVKRLIDALTAFLFLLTFPLHLFFVKQPFNFFKNCFRVLAGSKTWVGYSVVATSLPRLRRGILSPAGTPVTERNVDEKNRIIIDYWYARNWEPRKDMDILLKNYRQLGS